MISNKRPPLKGAGQSKMGKITFVFDERLSRPKTAALMRITTALRQFADIRFVAGSITEDELVKQLSEDVPHLVFAPWYRYLSWSRVEALYGLTRTSGPTFVGYHFGQLLPYELGDQADHLRAILLDFGNSTDQEIVLMVKALIHDNRRTGILPLLEVQPSTPVYYESWQEQQGLGFRIDSILSLPEVAQCEWTARSGALRIIMGALWSLVYEEGPGKSEFAQTIPGSAPRACFQVGINRSVLAFRLCYSMPNWSPKDLLQFFWPRKDGPTHPSQLLLKYTDFLRAHHIAETNDIEIVGAFFKSGVGERHPEEVHSLWIEPIAANRVSEIPYDTASPERPHLKPMPAITELKARPSADDSATIQAARERLTEANALIRDLKRAIQDKDRTILELRSGGVGTAAPLPPPETEDLLEAFQERYFQAKFEIQDFEAEIDHMATHGAAPNEVAALQQKMSALAKRQEGWIRKLAETLKSYQEDRAQHAARLPKAK